MKKIVIVFMVAVAASTYGVVDKLQEHIQMHEGLAAAHENIADCLREKKNKRHCKKEMLRDCLSAMAPPRWCHEFSSKLFFVYGKGNIEKHEKMAAAHEHEAECLQAGGSVEACQEAMFKECRNSGAPRRWCYDLSRQLRFGFAE